MYLIKNLLFHTIIKHNDLNKTRYSSVYKSHSKGDLTLRFCRSSISNLPPQYDSGSSPRLISVCGSGSLFACHCWPLCGIETKAIVSAATKRDTLALGPPYFLTLLMPWYGAAPSLTPHTHTPTHTSTWSGRRKNHTHLHPSADTHSSLQLLLCRSVSDLAHVNGLWIDIYESMGLLYCFGFEWALFAVYIISLYYLLRQGWIIKLRGFV